MIFKLEIEFPQSKSKKLTMIFQLHFDQSIKFLMLLKLMDPSKLFYLFICTYNLKLIKLSKLFIIILIKIICNG